MGGSTHRECNMGEKLWFWCSFWFSVKSVIILLCLKTLLPRLPFANSGGGCGVSVPSRLTFCMSTCYVYLDRICACLLKFINANRCVFIPMAMYDVDESNESIIDVTLSVSQSVFLLFSFFRKLINFWLLGGFFDVGLWTARV